MSKPIHTVIQAGTGWSDQDRATLHGYSALAYPAGNGDPATVGVGTPGVGYATIPTVAFANAGAGASATAVANMGVVAPPTITAGGTGGTPGAVTLTGTDGTGTKFQVTGTINGSGVLTGALVVIVAGVYTALPGTLTAGAVSGGSLTGCTLNLSASFGVVSYTVSNGSSNHKYPQGTTAALSGGTPTTAAVPGAVAVTTVAGQGSSLVVASNLPATYIVLLGDTGADVTSFVTGRSATGFTLNFEPRLAANSLAAGSVDVMVIH